MQQHDGPISKVVSLTNFRINRAVPNKSMEDPCNQNFFEEVDPLQSIIS